MAKSVWKSEESFKKKLIEETSVNQIHKKKKQVISQERIRRKTLSSVRDEKSKEDQREQMGVAEIGGCGSGCRR